MTDSIAVVFGASGRTGAECVRRLLEEGWRVRAAARDVSKLGGAADERLEKVVGDVSSRESVSRCLEGASKVIFAAAASSYFSAAEVDDKGVEVVATVGKEKGVQQMVLVSSCYVTPKNRFKPIRMLLNSFKWGLMDSKFKGEEKLRNSGVPFTIVRPGGLSVKTGEPVNLCTGQGDVGSGMISRRNVAAVCCAALKSPKAISKTFELWSVPGEDAQPLEDQLKNIFDNLNEEKYL